MSPIEVDVRQMGGENKTAVIISHPCVTIILRLYAFVEE